MPIKHCPIVGVLLLCLIPSMSEATNVVGSTQLTIVAQSYFSVWPLRATVVVVQGMSPGAIAAASSNVELPSTTVPASFEATPASNSIASPIGTRFSLQFYNRKTRKSCSSVKMLLPPEFVSDGMTFAIANVALTGMEGSCSGTVNLTWKSSNSSGLIFKRKYIGSSNVAVRGGEASPYQTDNEVTVSGSILGSSVSEPCFSSFVPCLSQTMQTEAGHEFIVPVGAFEGSPG